MELDRCLQCHSVHRGLVVATACICVEVMAENLHPVHGTDRKLGKHRGLGSMFDGQTDRRTDKCLM